MRSRLRVSSIGATYATDSTQAPQLSFDSASGLDGRFMLPDAEHLPTVAGKEFVVFAIALHVSCDL
jgi:hypothetical protein